MYVFAHTCFIVDMERRYYQEHKYDGELGVPIMAKAGESVLSQKPANGNIRNCHAASSKKERSAAWTRTLQHMKYGLLQL
jgi:hypothetical protein